ncbi:hypothetical protein [Pseudarthrobacter sp. S9]|uniref:hypothetical protein n=1 Tax=Pseudarthrobacter sp. S9 TaxID=3418421 RepID=UPI003CFE9C07
MSTIERIDIQVTSRHLLDERLDAAVRNLQEIAVLTGTHGILITRNGPGHFTAELSDQVPYGISELLH